MTRPKLRKFTACGDTYYGIVAEAESPDHAQPVLRVPAHLADQVKVEWPKPSGYARRAMNRA